MRQGGFVKHLWMIVQKNNLFVGREKRGRGMIYVFIRSIKEMGHCVRHFFQALTCEYYYVESHGLPMCKARNEVWTCEWYWCPKHKEWYWCPKHKGGEEE